MSQAGFAQWKIISPRVIDIIDEILDELDRIDILRTYDFNIASDMLPDREQSQS